ncbi:phage baseplate protein [Shewanella psychrotolerans]|uniref:phage baseplate protein n=1 Tax=Shewanella psychrotolerans TaxID=2864206 RepID=UPI001C656811|nr:hypothetical protein [Shewanella psychrotolerans]QYK01486.1 hypothetical protein K0I62_00335 [Shewanella psychrotolerans]
MKWNLLFTVILTAALALFGYLKYTELQKANVANSQQLAALSKQIANAGSIIPTKTIAYFDLASCPEGWQAYDKGRGRFPLAVNNQDNDLSVRKLNTIGGTEKHKLTIQELPKHTHVYDDWYYYDSGNEPEYATGEGDDVGMRQHQKRRTEPEGHSIAHNNMPPFVVLLQCIKL